MLQGVRLSPGLANPLEGATVDQVEIQAEIDPGDAQEVIFQVRGAKIVYDVAKQELFVNQHRAPAPIREGKQKLIILCDRNGLEVFASDGLTYTPLPFLPDENQKGLGVEAKGGTARLIKLEATDLKSAWDTPK